MTASGPALLWLRAGLLASICVVLGVGAHAAAMGALPGPGTLAVLLAVTTALCAVVLRRPSGGRRVVGLSVGGQLGVHLALALTARDHGSMSGMSPGRMLLEHTGLPMLALHLVAALAVGLWLAHGERVLWALLAALGGALLALVRWAPVAVRPPAAPTPPCPSRPLPLHLRARCVVRRGPPALLAA